MNDTSMRSGGLRRGLRRAAALAAAAGLLLVGVLMAGPAVAASAAEPAVPPAATELLVPPAVADEAVTDASSAATEQAVEGIVPVGEEAAAEPISAVIDEVTRPLGLTIFVASAVTLGAGAIVAGRLIAHNRQRVPVRGSAGGDGRG